MPRMADQEEEIRSTETAEPSGTPEKAEQVGFVDAENSPWCTRWAVTIRYHRVP